MLRTGRNTDGRKERKSGKGIHDGPAVDHRRRWIIERANEDSTPEASRDNPARESSASKGIHTPGYDGWLGGRTRITYLEPTVNDMHHGCLDCYECVLAESHRVVGVPGV
jgi:hypothetical protein